MNGDGDDIRADVTAALAGTLGEDNGELPSAEAPDAGGSTGGDAPAAPVAEGVEAAPAESGASPEEAPKPGEGGRVRDASGRFVQGKGDAPARVAPKPAPSAAVPPGKAPATLPPKGQGAPGGAPAQPVDALKAPQSWKPAAREAWAKVPADIRAALEPDITRREKETAQALETSAYSRKVHEAFAQAATPYEAMFRADGVNAIQAASNLFQTAYALRTGGPAQKAALVARIIQSFGVPVDTLAAALSGQPEAQAQQQAPPPAQFKDPRVDQWIAHQQAQERRQVQTELQALQEKAEFLPDVKEHMAVLMETGQAQTLEEAYEQATWANRDIRGILQKRQAVEAANASTASTQRARAASMSVRSKPATAAPPAAKAGGVEDDVRAALAELRSR
jgi:hypothetical protein